MRNNAGGGSHEVEANGLVQACCLHKQQNLLREAGIVSWQAAARQYVQMQVCVNMSTHAHFCPQLCARTSQYSK